MKFHKNTYKTYFYSTFKASFKATFKTIFFIGLTCVLPNSAFAQKPLLSHVAVYDVSLKDADERTGLTAMSGVMAHDFQASQCEGYTSNFRFAVKVVNGDSEFVSDQTAITYESADGKEFSFSDRSFLNNQLENEIKGNATSSEKGVNVDLKSPKIRKVDLKTAIFPTVHYQQIIEKALKGESFYQADIYDGSSEADKLVRATTIIGKQKIGLDKDAIETKVLQKFKDEPFWPVTISYFYKTDKKVEAMPDYMVSFKLYENGLARDLTMDYGDYRLKAFLKELKILPEKMCNLSK